MQRRAFIFVLMMFFAYSSLAEASELYGTIWYKGKPLQNADITILDKKSKTNDHGYYSIELNSGHYTLKIKLPDGKVKEEKVDIFPQDTEKNLKLD